MFINIVHCSAPHSVHAATVGLSSIQLCHKRLDYNLKNWCVPVYFLLVCERKGMQDWQWCECGKEKRSGGEMLLVGGVTHTQLFSTHKKMQGFSMKMSRHDKE